MCGRYASTLPPDLLASMFSAVIGRMTNLEPNENVSPTQAGAVVRLHPETRIRHIDFLRRGLIPN